MTLVSSLLSQWSQSFFHIFQPWSFQVSFGWIFSCSPVLVVGLFLLASPQIIFKRVRLFVLIFYHRKTLSCTWQDAFGDDLLSVTRFKVVVSVVEQEAVEFEGQKGSSGWVLQLVVGVWFTTVALPRSGTWGSDGLMKAEETRRSLLEPERHMVSSFCV